jgi:pimeloyl-ACP methyl ester carboxylesterase
MPVEERWTRSGDVRLQWLEANRGAAPRLTPLLYVPGAFGMAEYFRDEMAALAPRHTLSVSLRGHGRSDGPARGYSPDQFVSDLESIVTAAALPPFCLMAYSMGVLHALGYAAQRPASLRGLILLDYPAARTIRPEWAERVLASVSPEVARPHVVRGIAAEFPGVDRWGDLSRISCPVLVVRGGRSDALLTEEEGARYAAAFPAAELVTFVESGHELWVPDYNRFMSTIRSFLGRLDET